MATPSCSDCAVIYARFSSHNQREESIDQQIAECRVYAEAHSLSVIHVYADEAITGRTERRPQFQRMRRDARQGKFSCIIAYKSNRLARNILNALLLENEMERLGVRVVYAREEFGDNPAGRFALRMMMNVNQFYSENMAEDIRRNQRDNALRCKANGPAPYGYRSDDEGHFQIDPQVAPVILEIFERVARGERLTQIAADLNQRQIPTQRGNAWGKNSFASILKNERYTGVYLFDGTRTEGGMPVIVPRDLFDQVQKRRALQTVIGHTAKERDFLLTGLLYCGECRCHMIGVSGKSASGTRYPYYVCTGKRRGRQCTKRAIRQERLETGIMTVLSNTVLSDLFLDELATAAAAYQEDPAPSFKPKRREEVEASIKNLLSAMEQGVVTPSIKERLVELEAERDELMRQEKESPATASPPPGQRAIRDWLTRFRQGNVDDIELQRKLFHTFVMRAYAYEDGHIGIQFCPFGASLPQGENEPEELEFTLWDETP